MSRRTLALLVFPLLVVACSDDTRPPLDGRVLADKGPPGERRGDLGVDRTLADAGVEALFCGTLVDGTGAAIPAGDVIICLSSDVCLNGSADDQGAFCVAATRPGTYFFHAPEKTVDGKQQGDVIFPIAVTAEDVSSRARIELGTIVKPIISKTAMLDNDAGGTLDFGDSTTLVVPPKAGQCALFKTCSLLGFAEVPVDKIHPRLLATRSGSPTPVFAYLLVPFDMKFSAAATFKAPTPLSSSPVTLDAYHANSDTGALESMGQTTVVNGMLSQAMPALGWWLFYQP